MKYSTAVDRLRTVASDLTAHAESPWQDQVIVEAYVYGGLLDAPETLEVIMLALVVDLPPEKVTWLAHPTAPEAAASLLRFDKYPLRSRWRPTSWPVWNQEIVGPVRFWSEEDGTDESPLDALADRRLDQLERSMPQDEDSFRTQLRTELKAARRHLESVVDSYHDPEWRRSHKSFAAYPEDHLWRATKGFLELDNALRTT